MTNTPEALPCDLNPAVKISGPPRALSQARRAVRWLASGLAVAIAFGAGAAPAEGLLRIADCRIVDDRGPVKAMGVNYVDGFWNFAKDGERASYLPALDALAEAKVPFIRMAFGPWAPSKLDGPAAPAIADFVANRARYFERLDTFLDDAKARHISVVLDVFWNVDPYSAYFGEPATAWSHPESRTGAFLREVVAELGRRHGADPTIWMIEFLNEGNLLIDFPRAPHSRDELVALIDGLAGALRAAGDRHLMTTGNSLPMQAAEHLYAHQGWTPDSRDEFLRALDAETPARSEVASVHLYPSQTAGRPWDDGDILNALPLLNEHSLKTCQPVFVGEFGATDRPLVKTFIDSFTRSDIQLTAVWGFGRVAGDPYSIGIDALGRELLLRLGRGPGR